MNLTTFLANDAADSATKTSKILKYVDRPGGADYYWALKSAAKKMFLDGEPYDQAVGVMANMTVDHQRLNNQQALKAAYDWKIQNPGEALPPPSGSVSAPKGELTIKLEPAWAIKRKGKFEAYVPWTFKNERLSRPTAGIGIWLLESGLQHDDYENWDFYLIDLVTKKRFGRSCITKSTALATMSALEAQENIYLNAKKSA
ncbi:hypothetical protein G5B46_21530 [Caulobacter sp. 602-2]|uniref:Uncharacterized protein n=1 Tax=Caulobacter sp. 602-2 TaxID=2710887 RepID=A0A6G4R4X1_9CAUL|nr:hypothetical protein [Caulobacter sp. 602-2]NGM52198.1 hypothetical protein [Caulobacter sp. 602-2]